MPLLGTAAPAPAPAQAPAGTARGGAPPWVAPARGFAVRLGADPAAGGQAATATAGGSGGASAGPDDDLLPEETPADAALAAAPGQPQPPTPWPPAGLAGLGMAAPAGAPAQAAAATAGMGGEGDAPPAGGPSAAPLPVDALAALAGADTGSAQALPQANGATPGQPASGQLSMASTETPAATATALASGAAAMAAAAASAAGSAATGDAPAAPMDAFNLALAADGAEPSAPAAFALPQLAGAPGAAREPAPLLAAPATLPTPDLRAEDFSERFGAQLRWMAGQEIGHARIRVSPRELGPVEVVLRLDGEALSASFSSSHPETRQALEQGLPRLRDLLGEQGFQLAHADVGSQAPQSQDDAGQGGAAGGGPEGGRDPATPAGASAAAAGAVPTRSLRGLVDAYA